MEIMAILLIGFFYYEGKKEQIKLDTAPKVEYITDNMLLCSKACESGDLAHYRKGSLECQCKVTK